MNTTAGFSKKFVLSSALAGMAITVPYSTNTHAATPSTKKFIMDTVQTLRFGSRGEAVRSLQRILIQKNISPGNVDGIYGPHTQSAVIRYQQKNGLRVDGIAGPQTKRSLHTVEGKYVSSQKLLSMGDRGHEVRIAQSELQSLGYYHGHIDGIFGPLTKDAVKHFQAANDLKTDGIIGPHTRTTLFGEDPKPAQVPTIQQSSHSSSLSGNTPASSQPKSSGHTGLVSWAKQFIGTPYQWGGTTPSGFDCSGFIDFVFQKYGIHLPRTVSSIWNCGVPVDHANVGDLVFFETYKPGPSHVGIYVGHGRFLHADADRGISISKLNGYYWKSHYIGAERIVQN